MYVLTNKPEMAGRLYRDIAEMASEERYGTDAVKLVMILAGVMAETYMVFDEPDKTMEGSLHRLSQMLDCEPLPGPGVLRFLPPAHVIDFETERGRFAARQIFEDWMDCAYEFHELMLLVVHNVLVSWEDHGQQREESFRILVECVKAAMSFEIAAQEFCDFVIDEKVAQEGWNLPQCIAALSAVAGRKVAQSLDLESCSVFKGSELPEILERVVFVMTQEAVRLGVPAGTDWRFGLAANDTPANAPLELIEALEPGCGSFFKALDMRCLYFQSVCYAKAAGRMIAVAAGGEVPEMEPAIAKPLAMAAITETYKSVCMDYAILSC